MMSSPLRKRVFDKTGGQCAYCGLELHEDDVTSLTSRAQSWMEIDHVVPVKDGGSLGVDNMLPSCSGCNQSKSGKTLEAFRYHCSKRVDSRPNIPKDVLLWLDEVGVTLPQFPKYTFWFEMTGVSRYDLRPDIYGMAEAAE